MNHDEFIRQVRLRAALSDKEAEIVCNAVLETLAEWVLGKSPDTLTQWVLKKEPVDSTQLPKGIADYLEYARSPRGETFSLDEFFKQVSQRAEIDLSDAIYQSGVVMEVLQEAMGSKTEQLSQFPQEYITLFERESRKIRVNL